MSDQDILLVDKPKGITSFDVIRRLRRRLNIKKMGHAGTLDPLATGLMIIGVGEGTKKLNKYLKLDKVYEAEILLGQRTDSGDITGVVLEQVEIGEEAAVILSADKITAVLGSLTGTITLPVSAYSAIKQNGVPFYKKARAARAKGETVPEVELPLREMKVCEAKLTGTVLFDSASKTTLVNAEFHVASGTYIRSLAEELGRRLGYPATLKNLRRTKIGDFKIEAAISVE